MASTMFYLVSDDHQVIASARALAKNFGLTVKVFSQSEWKNRLNDPILRAGLSGEETQLSHGGAKILSFPVPAPSSVSSSIQNPVPSSVSSSIQNPVPSSVSSVEATPIKTIYQIEGVAIENAIYKYNGNLTEAAKALGIGRATLYRKVKQYNIDPSLARKKRAA